MGEVGRQYTCPRDVVDVQKVDRHEIGAVLCVGCKVSKARRTWRMDDRRSNPMPVSTCLLGSS